MFDFIFQLIWWIINYSYVGVGVNILWTNKFINGYQLNYVKMHFFIYYWTLLQYQHIIEHSNL